MKKIICLILGAVMLVCMTGWTTGDIWSPDTFDSETKSNYSRTDKLISSNDKYELWWIGSDCTIDLIEKATGNRWGVTARKAGEATVDPVTGMPIKVAPEVSSTLILEVLDNTNYQVADHFSAIGAVKNGRVVTEDIQNGIRIFYYFDEIEIRVAVDFVLRENSVAATLDPKLIQENDTYKVVSARIASFWCSTPNDEPDSYLFYPSGSGALVSNQTRGSAGVKYAAQVYGFDQSMTRETAETTEKSVRLPIFGAKTGNLASCAIIEQSAEAAVIGVKVGATSLKHSGAYALYQLRGYSENYTQQMNNKSERKDVYALSLAEVPMTIGFYPLTGDKANYSGMAETYKNYLKKSAALTTTTDDSPLNVSFVGGVMVSKSFLGVPYKDLIAATTLGEAKNILAELSEKTGSKISAKLYGFGSTGVEYNSYGGGFTINKNLGSLKDLSTLSDYCTQNNIDLYFDFDLVKLKNGSSGYSTFFDVAYSPLLKAGKVQKFDAAVRSGIANASYNLLSRALLKDGAEKMLKKTEKWNLPGISLAELTSVAYSDYSTETTEYFGKGKMAADVTEIMNKVSEKRKVAAYDANAYAAAAADIVYDAPTASSGERIFEEDVPFYQMVFKGYVPMTSESINLAVNPRVHLLRTVESGLGINYTLIANYYNEFIDYQGYLFFGSLYSDLGEDMVATYNSLKDYYAAINGAEINSHTTLDSGLRETVFSNGVKVYVNYTEASIVAPNGQTVEADGYVWEK